MIDSKNDIIVKVNNEDYFKTFKFRNSNNALILKNKEGFNQIEFYIKKTVDTRIIGKAQLNEIALGIEPVYGIRFNILSKWFEKYSFKSLSDQRNNPTIIANGSNFSKQKDFLSLENGKHFNEDYQDLKNNLINNSDFYFNKFKNLESYYNYEVLPIFRNEKSLPNYGADWIFEYLTAVKLFEPERFYDMISILKKQIEYMLSRREPNVTLYNDKFDEIFDYLYKLDLKK